MSPGAACSLLVVAALGSAGAFDISQCIAPLGMESGQIPDAALSASSSYNSGNVGPQNARLNTELLGGAWCPAAAITPESREWVQVDLPGPTVVTAVGTQGRFGNGEGQEFTEAYVLDYWRPALARWVRYRDAKGNEVLPGNSNTYLEHKNRLTPAVWAQRLRLRPAAAHRRTVCLRLELYGCPWTAGIVSYTVPRGDRRPSGAELTDGAYDGGGDAVLRGGLGALVDGALGGSEARDPRRWLGWSNATRVVLEFHFDAVREFAAVRLHCSNELAKGIQVFAEATVRFSVGGVHWQREALRFAPPPDRIFDAPRAVTVPLRRRIAQHVRIELKHAAEWMLISEVTFDSDIAQGNFTTELAGAPGADGAVRASGPADPLLIAVGVGAASALLALAALGARGLLRRRRKCLASPPPPAPPYDSVRDLYTTYRCTSSRMSTLPVKSPRDEYSEPCALPPSPRAPAPAYSSVRCDQPRPPSVMSVDSSNYEYAVPELSSAPLLAPASDLGSDVGSDVASDVGSDGASDVGSDSSGRRDMTPERLSLNTHSSHNRTLQWVEDGRWTVGPALVAETRRRADVQPPLLARHRLRMLAKLAEGAFGTVYVAEADGVAGYGGGAGARLVAVKFLPPDATEDDRAQLERDARTLAPLCSPQLARVLGTLPAGLVLEYLPGGDLHAHLAAAPPPPRRALAYMCAQAAAAMRYLEAVRFVHRDLAARNCLIGANYQLKVCDLGTDAEAHAREYLRAGGRALPLRWAAPETAARGEYSARSDAWAFAVLAWEVYTLCRRRPHAQLADAEVLERLVSGALPRPGRPADCPRALYAALRACWRRDPARRPAFARLHRVCASELRRAD